ncbi:MAG: efflux RND transporter permease subunit [Candidatus Omnitrophica bacterium]|nr:efflux RND transporter permease subunit [Candidatus Omnitrophota bacterium]
MCEKLIAYFAERHLLTNLIFLTVLIGGVFAWQQTSKEEMPAITFDHVHVSVRYPGAPAEDVEYFVTRPLEEELRNVDGVYRLTSTSSVGQSSIDVELERGIPNIEEVLTEIRSTVLDVNLPDDIIDDPNVRVFKTAKKAILDIALIHKDARLLDLETRKQLQEYALALETQLLSLPQVSDINRRGYLQEEIQIRAYPERLVRYDIPFNTVLREIRENHIRQPAGSLEAREEPKVTVLSELDSPEKFREFIIQGGFEGQVVRLGEVAEVESGFEKNDSIIKVNGHEAVILNAVKSTSSGILEALDVVEAVVGKFRVQNLKDTPIELFLLDDESIDVRNRLSLISLNGGIGFVLILGMLFVFLNKRSGLWVAMGIPFSLCATMIGGHLMGYTINGTTLAAVIIVLGIVVDDAIVVAENINRLLRQGVAEAKAVVEGTSFVLLPIVASILTTCVAFIPLYFFEGRFGAFIEFIPPVIFLMLGASLFESLFILPAHMQLPMPLFLRRFSGSTRREAPESREKVHWFEGIEDLYAAFLKRVLPYRLFVFLGFGLLLVLASVVLTQKMKYEMFPNEETRDLVLTGETRSQMTRYETAEKIQEIEDVIAPYLGKEVVGFRSGIARSRRGGSAEENKFRITIEIVPKEKRRKSANQLIAEIEQKVKGLEGYGKVEFRKSRWGQESGSPIEILVQQNNDAVRAQILETLVEEMQKYSELRDVEIDEGLMIPEYRIRLNREKLKRLSISPSDVASTFRAALEGSVLYEFSDGDEEVRVRLTTVDEAKTSIEQVLRIPVENRSNYLVPLADIVTVEPVMSPSSIARHDLKRTSRIYAGLSPGSQWTPLDAAGVLEKEVFPKILSKYPTTLLTFAGEIQDTRESQSDFRNAVILALLLIYFILAILFGSLIKPVIIMLVIPFGLVGIILAFYLHGKMLFGFYAAVGALGLAGVVINDSIIMMVKLDKDFDPKQSPETVNPQIAEIAKTRLRAVLLTTITTVVGMFPTAYGLAGYDAMLAEMMLALTWGMIFGTLITLLLMPCVYRVGHDFGLTQSKSREGVLSA